MYKSISIGALLVTLVCTGCATHRSLDDKWSVYEKNDYQGWEQSDAYFSRMKAMYEGFVPARLALTYQNQGKSDFQNQVEDTLGIDVTDGLYVSTAFIGDITATNVIGTILGTNSNAPNFGSHDRVAIITQRSALKRMGQNSLFYVSSIDSAELPKQSKAQSAHHELHLQAKELFIGSLERASNKLNKEGFSCVPKGYDAANDDHFRSEIVLKPLDQYRATYVCSDSDSSFDLFLESMVLKGESNYEIVQVLTLTNLPQLELFSDDLLFESSDWQSMMSTCRTCDDNLDRTVVLRSKSQDEDWTEKYEKGTIYL